MLMSSPDRIANIPGAHSAEHALRLVPRLTRWAQSRVGEDDFSRLSLRQLTALQLIEHQESTLGDVARQLMVTPAVVTGLIDRLERQGYVERVNSTRDRRRVHLRITPAGRGALEGTEQRLTGELAEQLSTLPSEELAHLQQGLEVFDRVLLLLEEERRSGRR